jgi:hypothetical protein
MTSSQRRVSAPPTYGLTRPHPVKEDRLRGKEVTRGTEVDSVGPRRGPDNGVVNPNALGLADSTEERGP